MLLTTISGKLNYPPAGDEYRDNPSWLSLSLYSIETMGWAGWAIILQGGVIQAFA
jgi:hypothetical protein